MCLNSFVGLMQQWENRYRVMHGQSQRGGKLRAGREGDEHLANQEVSCVVLGCSPDISCRAMQIESLPPPPRKFVVERPK